MQTWIALLRGINVGGHRPLPMKELTALFERAGFESVRTYIQSGNVVFRSPKGTSGSLATQIRALIRKQHGFEPEIVVLGGTELKQAIERNPFPQALSDPRLLHLFFLSSAPTQPDLESLTRLRSGREGFVLQGKVFYLHTPDGFNTSRLAARIERHLGVPATARNWRTVSVLQTMLDEIA